MILSDKTLREYLSTGDIKIDPLPDDKAIQPASIDLRLGCTFIWWADPRFQSQSPDPVLVPKTDRKGFTREVNLSHGEKYVVHPGEFLLAATLERVTVGNSVVGQINGKSSLARDGLIVHATAGFLDPGFDGNVTLEIANLNQYPIELTVGMSICQVVFIQLTTPAERPYGSQGLGSHYQHSEGVILRKE